MGFTVDSYQSCLIAGIRKIPLIAEHNVLDMEIAMIQHIITSLLVPLEHPQQLIKESWLQLLQFFSHHLHLWAPLADCLDESFEVLHHKTHHRLRIHRDKTFDVALHRRMGFSHEEGEGVEFGNLAKHLRGFLKAQSLLAHYKLWANVFDKNDLVRIQARVRHWGCDYLVRVDFLDDALHFRDRLGVHRNFRFE